jgi:hypothetical protein
MFLIYGGNKEFVVKVYIDASFDADLDDPKSQTGYVKWSSHFGVVQNRALRRDLHVKRIFNALSTPSVIGSRTET